VTYDLGLRPIERVESPLSEPTAAACQGDEDVGPGARPNPLGMHVVGILAVEDLRIRVRDLLVVQNLTSRCRLRSRSLRGARM
jgi:hypothetical protein